MNGLCILIVASFSVCAISQKGENIPAARNNAPRRHAVMVIVVGRCKKRLARAKFKIRTASTVVAVPNELRRIVSVDDTMIERMTTMKIMIDEDETIEKSKKGIGSILYSRYSLPSCNHNILTVNTLHSTDIRTLSLPSQFSILRIV